MCQDKVFASCFPYDSWVRFVAGDVFAHSLPDVLKNTCWSSKMDSRKIWVLKNHVSCCGSVHIDQVDYAIRYAGLFEYFHKYLGGIDLGVGHLPHDGISHQRGWCRQVACNGCKVEGSQGKNEALEGPLLQSIPNPCSGNGRLLGIDFAHVFHIEAEEVNKFTCRINFCLKGIFGLSKHGSCIDSGTVRACE